MVTGSVLEAHLRKLCDKNGIPTVKADGKSKTGEPLNQDLAAAGVYSKLELKNVTAWLDLRNKAAHGEYKEYDATHVDDVLRSVRSFMTRYPA